MTDTLQKKEIAMTADWDFIAQVDKMGQAGKLIADTGLTVSGYLSLTDGGTAIANTTVTLAPLANRTHEYLGTLGASTIATAVSGLSSVYQVIQIGSQKWSRQLTVIAVARPVQA
jgi:hypothetical protein